MRLKLPVEPGCWRGLVPVAGFEPASGWFFDHVQGAGLNPPNAMVRLDGSLKTKRSIGS